MMNKFKSPKLISYTLHSCILFFILFSLTGCFATQHLTKVNKRQANVKIELNKGVQQGFELEPIVMNGIKYHHYYSANVLKSKPNKTRIANIYISENTLKSHSNQKQLHSELNANTSISYKPMENKNSTNLPYKIRNPEIKHLKFKFIEPESEQKIIFKISSSTPKGKKINEISIGVLDKTSNNNFHITVKDEKAHLTLPNVLLDERTIFAHKPHGKCKGSIQIVKTYSQELNHDINEDINRDFRSPKIINASRHILYLVTIPLDTAIIGLSSAMAIASLGAP
jgi:hypothetical protein